MLHTAIVAVAVLGLATSFASVIHGSPLAHSQPPTGHATRASRNAPEPLAPENCKCPVKAVVTDSQNNPSGGLNVTGCGACLGIFAEVLNKKKGECLGTSNCPPGDPVKCKGDVKVTVSSSAMACCGTTYPGGWSPSWGSGNFVWGSSADRTYANMEASCNEESVKTITIALMDDNGETALTITRKIKLVCGICGADEGNDG